LVIRIGGTEDVQGGKKCAKRIQTMEKGQVDFKEIYRGKRTSLESSC